MFFFLDYLAMHIMRFLYLSESESKRKLRADFSNTLFKKKTWIGWMEWNEATIGQRGVRIFSLERICARSCKILVFNKTRCQLYHSP